MAEISKIKLPSGDVYDIKDSRVGNAKIFYGTCNTAAATVAKVVTCPDFTEDDLVKGALIFVKFDYTNSGAVANLTLNVNSTGAKPLKKQYNATGSNNLAAYGELVADSTYLFQYNGTNWICMTLDYNSTYTLYNLPEGAGNYKTSSVLYRYELLFQQDDDTLTPLNNVSNGVDNTSKAILTNVEFDPFGRIYYYDTTSGVSANGYINAGNLYYHYGVDLRYTFNISTTVNALTVNKNVYLKVSPQSNGKVKLASATPLVQDLPTTNDGYYYIFLGRAYSTYQIILYTEHPVYYHNGTEITELLSPKQKAGIEDLMSEIDTVTGDSLTANNIILGNGSSTIKSSGKTIATTLGTDDTTVPTSKAVKDAIDALPEPMIFKGTLGTGGTITSLPAAAAGNTGYTYKVITDGTYQSIAAKAGDTFISNGSTWTLIPSGDEPSGTVTSVTLKATSPIAIDSSAAITTSGTRTISHADSGVTAGTYKSVTVDAKGHVTGGTNPTTLSGYGITDGVQKITSTDEAIVRFDGTDGTIQNSNATINDSGLLSAKSIRSANTIYGISFARTNDTPKETILKTGIKWVTSKHMPVIHITGYAYGLQSPVEFKIGFYIYSGKIGWAGVTNMGSWAPEVYLFKYTNSNNIDCVAVGLKGSCYFLQLSCDLQDEMGKFADVLTDSSNWSWEFLTTEGNIPQTDGGTTCSQVPYKADILSQKWSQITNTPTTLSGYGITDAINTSSTAQTKSGNLTAAKFIKSGGTSSQFLKADGSVDSNTYITSASLPSAMSASEANTGTATTARTISASVLSGAIDNKLSYMTTTEVTSCVNTIFN